MMKGDMMAAAQTASLGDQDIMTYIPSPPPNQGGVGNGDGSGQQQQQETMDDMASFSASLDALLANTESTGAATQTEPARGMQFTPPTALTWAAPQVTVPVAAAGDSTTPAKAGGLVSAESASVSGWSTSAASLSTAPAPTALPTHFQVAYAPQQQQSAPAPQAQVVQSPGDQAGVHQSPMTHASFVVGGPQHLQAGQAAAAQAQPAISYATAPIYAMAATAPPQEPQQQGLPHQPATASQLYAPTGIHHMMFPAQTTSFSAPLTTSGPPQSKSRRGMKRRVSSSMLQGKEAPPVSEDEDERKRRRLDRNMREQQRSHKITEQIGELREVLASANVHFKNDKHSTLVSVVEYIKQLQTRSALLDTEHKKLLETISKTDEMVKSHHIPFGSSSDPNSADADQRGREEVLSNSSDDDELMVFVRGLDYKSIFSRCGIALGIASVDGRFMDCNDEFVTLSGYSRDELLLKGRGRKVAGGTVGVPQEMGSRSEASSNTSARKNLSLFNLLSREDMERVFSAMSKMLKSPGQDSADAGSSLSHPMQHPALTEGQLQLHSLGPQNQQQAAIQAPLLGKVMVNSDKEDHKIDHWSGVVRQSRRRDVPLRMNITLVRSSDGRPKFFNCALTPEGT